jgi:hypothetical protein
MVAILLEIILYLIIGCLSPHNLMQFCLTETVFLSGLQFLPSNLILCYVAEYQWEA